MGGMRAPAENLRQGVSKMVASQVSALGPLRGGSNSRFIFVRTSVRLVLSWLVLTYRKDAPRLEPFR